MWDEMLSKKIKIWGVAVDDSHHFKEEFAPHRYNPGRGWVEVFAKNLSEIRKTSDVLAIDKITNSCFAKIASPSPQQIDLNCLHCS